MERIPILRVQEVLLISLQVDLSDSVVDQLQEDVLLELERRPAKGLVLDLSSVQILDTFTARALAQTAQMARLMGARTVVSGMNPSVVLTLTEMGFNARGFKTTLDLDSAVEQLNAKEASKDAAAKRRTGHRF